MAGRPRIHVEERRSSTYRFSTRFLQQMSTYAKAHNVTVTALLITAADTYMKGHQHDIQREAEHIRTH